MNNKSTENLQDETNKCVCPFYSKKEPDDYQIRLKDADRTICNRDVLIKLLQDQLKKIEELYKKNLNEAQDVKVKYYAKVQELNKTKKLYEERLINSGLNNKESKGDNFICDAQCINNMKSIETLIKDQMVILQQICQQPKDNATVPENGVKDVIKQKDNIIENLQKENYDLKHVINKYETMINTQNTENRTTDKDFDIMAKMNDMKKKMDSIIAESNQSKTAIENLEAKLQNNDNSITELKTKSGDTESLCHCNSLHEQKETKNDDIENRLKDLEDKCSCFEISAQEKENDKIDNNSFGSFYKNQIDSLNEKCNELQKNTNNIDLKIDKLINDLNISYLHEKINDLYNEVDNLKGKRNSENLEEEKCLSEVCAYNYLNETGRVTIISLSSKQDMINESLCELCGTKPNRTQKSTISVSNQISNKAPEIETQNSNKSKLSKQLSMELPKCVVCGTIIEKQSISKPESEPANQSDHLSIQISEYNDRRFSAENKNVVEPEPIIKPGESDKSSQGKRLSIQLPKCDGCGTIIENKIAAEPEPKTKIESNNLDKSSQDNRLFITLSKCDGCGTIIENKIIAESELEPKLEAETVTEPHDSDKSSQNNRLSITLSKCDGCGTIKENGNASEGEPEAEPETESEPPATETVTSDNSNQEKRLSTQQFKCDGCEGLLQNVAVPTTSTSVDESVGRNHPVKVRNSLRPSISEKTNSCGCNKEKQLQKKIKSCDECGPDIDECFACNRPTKPPVTLEKSNLEIQEPSKFITNQETSNRKFAPVEEKPEFVSNRSSKLIKIKCHECGLEHWIQQKDITSTNLSPTLKAEDNDSKLKVDKQCNNVCGDEIKQCVGCESSTKFNLEPIQNTKEYLEDTCKPCGITMVSTFTERVVTNETKQNDKEITEETVVEDEPNPCSEELKLVQTELIVKDETTINKDISEKSEEAKLISDDNKLRKESIKERITNETELEETQSKIPRPCLKCKDKTEECKKCLKKNEESILEERHISDLNKTSIDNEKITNTKFCNKCKEKIGECTKCRKKSQILENEPNFEPSDKILPPEETQIPKAPVCKPCGKSTESNLNKNDTEELQKNKMKYAESKNKSFTIENGTSLENHPEQNIFQQSEKHSVSSATNPSGKSIGSSPGITEVNKDHALEKKCEKCGNKQSDGENKKQMNQVKTLEKSDINTKSQIIKSKCSGCNTERWGEKIINTTDNETKAVEEARRESLIKKLKPCNKCEDEIKKCSKCKAKLEPETSYNTNSICKPCGKPLYSFQNNKYLTENITEPNSGTNKKELTDKSTCKPCEKPKIPITSRRETNQKPSLNKNDVAMQSETKNETVNKPLGESSSKNEKSSSKAMCDPCKKIIESFKRQSLDSTTSNKLKNEPPNRAELSTNTNEASQMSTCDPCGKLMESLTKRESMPKSNEALLKLTTEDETIHDESGSKKNVESSTKSLNYATSKKSECETCGVEFLTNTNEPKENSTCDPCGKPTISFSSRRESIQKSLEIIENALNKPLTESDEKTRSLGKTDETGAKTACEPCKKKLESYTRKSMDCGTNKKPKCEATAVEFSASNNETKEKLVQTSTCEPCGKIKELAPNKKQNNKIKIKCHRCGSERWTEEKPENIREKSKEVRKIKLNNDYPLIGDFNVFKSSTYLENIQLQQGVIQERRVNRISSCTQTDKKQIVCGTYLKQTSSKDIANNIREQSLLTEVIQCLSNLYKIAKDRDINIAFNEATCSCYEDTSRTSFKSNNLKIDSDICLCNRKGNNHNTALVKTTNDNYRVFLNVIKTFNLKLFKIQNEKYLQVIQQLNNHFKSGRIRTNNPLEDSMQNYLIDLEQQLDVTAEMEIELENLEKEIITQREVLWNKR